MISLSRMILPYWCLAAAPFLLSVKFASSEPIDASTGKALKRLELPTKVSLEVLDKDPSLDFLMYQTSKKTGERFRFSSGRMEKVPSDILPITFIDIDPSIRYQSIMGFGGAITDAVAHNFQHMEQSVVDDILEAYYGRSGIGYGIGRLTIGGCDFSTEVYTYADLKDEDKEDFDLEHFSIQKDMDSGKLGLIKEVIDIANNRSTGSEMPYGLKFFASAWSAPNWMKDNNKPVHGKLKGGPMGKYYKSWALYYDKFLESYKAQGVDIFAVTAQNEPHVDTSAKIFIKWNSLDFDAVTQRDFIKYQLGPRLKKSHPNVQIIILDDIRELIVEWSTTVLSDKLAASYVSGIGVHWYGEVENLFPRFDLINKTHELFPSKYIIGTEACNGYLPVINGPRMGDWYRGELYAIDIIGDLGNWATAWTDWNIALDLKGGPNWAGNFVDAPILLDTKNQKDWYIQPMFYYLAHFSRFVPPGSVRIDSTMKSKKRGLPFYRPTELETISFLTPEDKIAVVILNKGKVETNYTISVPGNGYITQNIPANSIQSILIKNKGSSSD